MNHLNLSKSSNVDLFLWKVDNNYLELFSGGCSNVPKDLCCSSYFCIPGNLVYISGGLLNKSNADFGIFECVFLSTPEVWLSDCDGLVLLVLVLLCASITIPLLFKVSIEDINIIPKIAIRTMILNSLFETRVLILFLFFTNRLNRKLYKCINCMD